MKPEQQEPGACLVFHPTRDEWNVPFDAFVSKVFKKHPDAPMIKVIPPKGWKPRRSPFPDLRKVTIQVPIRQHVFGTKGAYRCLFVEQKPMSVADFKAAAEQESQALKVGEAAARTSRTSGSPAAAATVRHHAAPAALAQRRRRSQDAPVEGATEPQYHNRPDPTSERAFWANVTLNPPLYGADTPTSFFDDHLSTGWNLRHLEGDLLKRHNVADVPGVTTPMTYFGMWRSFFGWHKEDNDLYSINYMHWGAPKVWYCVPPSQAARFERMAASMFPDLAKACSAFVRHKDIMLSPTLLRTFGISFVQARQCEGEFVVLNAAAYHGGFNMGFNCAEAVNFALKDWIPVGKQAVPCRCSALKDGVRISMRIFDPKYVDPYSEEEEEDDDREEDADGEEDADSAGGEQAARSDSDSDSHTHASAASGDEEETADLAEASGSGRLRGRRIAACPKAAVMPSGPGGSGRSRAAKQPAPILQKRVRAAGRKAGGSQARKKRQRGDPVAADHDTAQGVKSVDDSCESEHDCHSSHESLVGVADEAQGGVDASTSGGVETVPAPLAPASRRTRGKSADAAAAAAAASCAAPAPSGSAKEAETPRRRRAAVREESMLAQPSPSQTPGKKARSKSARACTPTAAKCAGKQSKSAVESGAPQPGTCLPPQWHSRTMLQQQAMAVRPRLVSSELASTRKARPGSSDAEEDVVGTPCAIVGEELDGKRFFYLVQVLRRVAKTPGHVCLRGMQVGRDGLYRPLYGSLWEEPQEALVAVRTQRVAAPAAGSPVASPGSGHSPLPALGDAYQLLRPSDSVLQQVHLLQPAVPVPAPSPPLSASATLPAASRAERAARRLLLRQQEEAAAQAYDKQAQVLASGPEQELMVLALQEAGYTAEHGPSGQAPAGPGTDVVGSAEVRMCSEVGVLGP